MANYKYTFINDEDEVAVQTTDGIKFTKDYNEHNVLVLSPAYAYRLKKEVKTAFLARIKIVGDKITITPVRRKPSKKISDFIK